MHFDRKHIKPEDAPNENVKDLIDVVGFDAVLKMSEVYGGEYIYYPKYDSWCAGERNRRIKREFNGCNYRELSKRYGVTPLYCREIIAGRSAYRQAGLF
jgi:Mor family transcriptional regulator